MPQAAVSSVQGQLVKILYCAIDQTVPGTKGGSVHVTAVAEGLAALGHEVHVLVTPGDGPMPGASGVHWIAMPPPLGRRSCGGCAAAPCASLRRASGPTSSWSGTTISAAKGF